MARQPVNQQVTSKSPDPGLVRVLVQTGRGEGAVGTGGKGVVEGVWFAGREGGREGGRGLDGILGALPKKPPPWVDAMCYAIHESRRHEVLNALHYTAHQLLPGKPLALVDPCSHAMMSGRCQD